MERLSDLADDLGLVRLNESLAELYTASTRANARIKILQTAISKIGTHTIEGVTPATGQYGYIPLDLGQFFDLMFELEALLAEDPDYRHSELPHRLCSFLEVGCGIGRNLHLLNTTDFLGLERVNGFDIVDEFVEVGKTYFDLGNKIFKDDALTFDYGRHDIVYFYRPFEDEDLQKQFEARVIETMKPGAYLVASLSQTLDGSRQLIPKGNSFSIWKRA